MSLNNLENLFLPLSVFLFLLNGYLILQLLRLRKKVDVFLRGEEKNLGEVLAGQIKKIQTQDKEIKDILKKVAHLDGISQRSFRKMGMVRFNPFKDVGSDQSFSVALLDSRDNGFVISSLYSREGNRVYAKPIEKGISQYPLSGEEKEAIRRATNA